MAQNEIMTLKRAILHEVESEKFYKYAAQRAKDPDAAESFLFLAGNESDHQRMLERILKRLEENPECSIDLDLELPPYPVVFKAPGLKNPEEATEMSVFHIAILMEKASIDYYRQAADATTSAPMRKLYEFLADWEWRHLDSMESYYDWLTEKWFEKQGFSTS